MIDFPDDVTLYTLRAAAALGPVLLPAALGPAAGAALRARAPDYRDYWLADRGRYRFCDSIQNPELFADLQTLAEAIAGVPTRAIAAARWTRHAQGDYALIKDDALFAPARAPGLELALDYSAAASDEGQVVWFDDRGSFVLPNLPGALAVVDRRRPLCRYERYLGARFGAGEIHRVRLFLTI